MISRELTAASTRPLLLAVLAEGESYGYAIIQRVHALSEEEIEWTEGMLYPVLHRMEEEGLLTSAWRVAENGRRRKYYRLKEQGLRAAEAERMAWMKVHQTLNQLWEARPALT